MKELVFNTLHMTQNLSGQLYSWLSKLEIPVSKKFLKEQLHSHPDYPSLASITDILDELGIENTAIEIDKESLHEIPVPFLAHLRSNGGEFVTVGNRNNLGKQFPKFFERWSGIVVIAEKPTNWMHEANKESLKKERKQNTTFALSFILLAAFIAVSVIWSSDWRFSELLLVAMAGIFTSWLIVSKELGLENKIADQVCGKETNCDSVIKSKGAKLPFGITWSDIGIIWFSFLFLSLLISSFTQTSAHLYIVLFSLSICSLPFTLFSIYYQWQIAKKWCRLCLITVALLWIQFAILFPVFLSLWKSDVGIFDNYTLVLAFILSLTMVTWLGIKALLRENKKLETETFAGQRFKNNTEIFMTLLEKQRKVDVTPFENDLQLGDADSPLQILVACNPYCGPCAKAHKILHELVEKNDIGLTVRFAVKTENKEHKKFKTVEYVLRLVKDTKPVYKRNALHNWYQEMDIEKFSDLYSLDGKAEMDVTKIIKQQELWFDDSKIQFTPTIFLNGYELPKEYKVHDLKLLIKGISEKIKTEIAEPKNELI